MRLHEEWFCFSFQWLTYCLIRRNNYLSDLLFDLSSSCSVVLLFFTVFFSLLSDRRSRRWNRFCSNRQNPSCLSFNRTDFPGRLTWYSAGTSVCSDAKGVLVEETHVYTEGEKEHQRIVWQEERIWMEWVRGWDESYGWEAIAVNYGNCEERSEWRRERERKSGSIIIASRLEKNWVCDLRFVVKIGSERVPSSQEKESSDKSRISIVFLIIWKEIVTLFLLLNGASGDWIRADSLESAS